MAQAAPKEQNKSPRRRAGRGLVVLILQALDGAVLPNYDGYYYARLLDALNLHCGASYHTS